MFTGIIQEIGRVKSSIRQGENLTIDIEAPQTSSKIKNGDSVSINGACQTVIKYGNGCLSVQSISETLKRTNLGEIRPGNMVNLELPLGLNDLLHGHLVQGHVDCVSTIVGKSDLQGSVLFSIAYPSIYNDLLIEKGSVAVDGVSLTISGVSTTDFQVSLIPHTLSNTIFRSKNIGNLVNLEFDMIAKYIKKMNSQFRGNITPEFLKEHGFYNG
jgi:riboflavin synthase